MQFINPEIPRDLTFYTKFHRNAVVPNLQECDDFEETLLFRSTPSEDSRHDECTTFWLIQEFDECLWLLTMSPNDARNESVIAWCNAPNDLPKSKVAEQLLYEWLLATRRHDFPDNIEFLYLESDLGIERVMEAANTSKGTPLHEAACINDVEFAQFLLRGGRIVNALDQDARTPLHIAIANNSVTTARILLCNGASREIADKDGAFPLDFVAEPNNSELVSMLEQSKENEVKPLPPEQSPTSYSLSEDPRSLLGRAERWYQRHEYQAGRHLFERLIRVDEATAEGIAKGIVGFVACGERMGEFSGFADGLQQVCDDNSIRADARAHALFWHGRLLHKKGDWDTAQNWFQSVVDLPASNDITAKALLRTAEWQYRQGNAQEALARLNLIIESSNSPSSVRARALIQRGAIRYDEGQTQMAINDFSQCLEINPVKSVVVAKALVARSRCFEELGDVTGVISDLLVAVNEHGHDAGAAAADLHNYGVRCNLRGQPENAFQYFKAVQGFRCNNPFIPTNALVNRGCFLADREEYDAAIVNFKIACSHPDIPERVLARALFNIGLARRYQGVQRAAIRHFTNVIEMNNPPPKTVAAALAYRGRCWNDLGKAVNALLDFGKVRKIPESESPVRADALLWSGICLQQLEDLDQAKEAFTELMDFNEASLEMRTRAKWGLGDVLIDEGDLEKAEGLLTEAMKVMEELDRHDLVGMIHKRLEGLKETLP